MDKAAETDVTTELAQKRSAWELEREAQIRWATTGSELHELQIHAQKKHNEDAPLAIAQRDEQHEAWREDNARERQLREVNEQRNAARELLVVREVKAFERIADALEKIAGAAGRG